MKANAKECDFEASRKRLLRAVACAEELLLRRLSRIKEDEERIDALLEMTDTAASEEGMSDKARKELLAAVSLVRCEDLSKLVSIIGVLAEKERELRTNRATSGSEAVRFEEM